MSAPELTASARARHPAGAPAGQVRFAHPSERVFARLLDLYEERWEYEPVEFPLEWDEHGHPGRRASGRISTSPSAACSLS